MKPLGAKAYGSIPHLPGSRRGPADRGLSDDQARILTERSRDSGDHVIVQEKLDGSCVSVARVEGSLLAINRAGYLARSSPRFNHHLFADWVDQNRKRFEFLEEGERIVGEWMAQTHGTLFPTQEPFFAFDLIRGTERALFDEMLHRARYTLRLPELISVGLPCSIDRALSALQGIDDTRDDQCEGAVWRVERDNKVDFLGKYVRYGKKDGAYLPENNRGVFMFNWVPQMEEA